MNPARSVRAFGALFREARDAAGLSLADVEKKTGINKGHLSEIETGKANPTVETMHKLASALDMIVEIELKPRPKRQRRNPG